MRKTFLTPVFIILILFQFMAVYAAEVLTDAQLDQVSAKGFDINIDAALSFRQAAGIMQNNAAFVVSTNGDINNANINNSNYIDAVSFSGAQVNQNNVAGIIALNGSISNSQINNLNQASISSIGSASVNQQGIAIVIASGSLDAVINNVNQVNVSGGGIINSGSSIVNTFTYKDFSGIISVTNGN